MLRHIPVHAFELVTIWTDVNDWLGSTSEYRGREERWEKNATCCEREFSHVMEFQNL